MRKVLQHACAPALSQPGAQLAVIAQAPQCLRQRRNIALRHHEPGITNYTGDLATSRADHGHATSHRFHQYAPKLLPPVWLGARRQYQHIQLTQALRHLRGRQPRGEPHRISNSCAHRLCTQGCQLRTSANYVHSTVRPQHRRGAQQYINAFFWHQPAHFILYLGTIEPRKNLTVLVAAYKQAQLENVKLFCAGGHGWMYAEVVRAVEELHLSRDVLFPGYVPEAELPLWYSAAEAFVYPSAYEGFGLPVLEALACGTPVITTTAGSLVEVAGNAAVLCAPDDAPALADAIVRVMGDPLLRGQLAASGPLQADRFCWQEAGRRTAATHLRALSPQQ